MRDEEEEMRRRAREFHGVETEESSSEVKLFDSDGLAVAEEAAEDRGGGVAAEGIGGGEGVGGGLEVVVGQLVEFGEGEGEGEGEGAGAVEEGVVEVVEEEGEG
ncbi:hypothetical protein Sjap_005001 [Stephania japonica]|uniref:Uncharacterized protein n=1 Tax=Stephania japonica TaxID=461633 RepID=A0AAP0K4S4_9MAGN